MSTKNQSMSRAGGRNGSGRIALLLAAAGAWVAMAAGPASATGVLTPIGAPGQPIKIVDHHVSVVINNGFARTEVSQSFFNPNANDLEAVYSFPVPVGAALSEYSVYAGEQEIHGEVLTKRDAEKMYQEEKAKGADAGLATKNTYQTFEFRVTPVRANAQTRMRFVYYEPLKVDTGVGRYVYPLEDGGTDDAAKSFWTANPKVEGNFSADIEITTAAPLADVRVPGQAGATTTRVNEGKYSVRIDQPGATLNKDLVLYYRLEENQPGKVEMLAYRPDKDKPGTFMMVLTPGIDLAPLDRGADYTFVLDVSGSMQTKLSTLARGVTQTLGAMSGKDRVRVIVFSDTARELTQGPTPATPENVKRLCEAVSALKIEGGTNIYDGLALAFKGIDADRATSVVLVTDGVTNTGVVDPAAFRALVKERDVRLFGFLMGNSANWPLVRTVCEASGGFYAGVSNDDDIVGQIMLAKSKITSECLHNAELKIRGVRTTDTTAEALGEVYRGQQVVVFGRYDKGGPATLTLYARLTGADKAYTTTFDFPEIDTAHPEIERLWAMNRVEAIEVGQMAGEMRAGEAQQAIESLGTQFQIVTDYTSMVVANDQAFKERGIERHNRQRVATEQLAQTQRASAPAVNPRVDQQQPMFQNPAPSLSPSSGRGGGGGGGAIDPISGAGLLLLAGLGAARAIRRRAQGLSA